MGLRKGVRILDHARCTSAPADLADCSRLRKRAADSNGFKPWQATSLCAEFGATLPRLGNLRNCSQSYIR